MKDVPIDPGEMTDLPSGWVQARVGEICEAVNGRAFKPSEWADAGKPIIRIQNLKDPSVRFNYYQGQVESKFDVNEGDLLFAWSGTPGTSFGAHLWRGPKALLNQHIFNIQFNRTEISPRYLEGVLNQNVSEFVRQSQGGVGLAHITKPKFNDSVIPLPPLPEQHRIVAEIETQFTRLDASVAALRRAQANLKRYRASVLRDACEGRLVPTEAELARSESREYEPADVLLERIQAERRARWESQEKRRGKYKEPSAPDTSTLPELPEGWVWANLEAVSELKGGVTKGQRYTSEQTLREVPYLRVANVQRGFLDLERITTIETSEENIERLQLKSGDVLFTEGGDRDKLGRGWVWKGEIEGCIHQNHVFRARPFPNSVIPEFVSWWGNSFGQDFFSRFGKQTTNLASINLTVLSQFPIPLPPLAEQRRIVAEVERRLSVVQQAEATVEASLARAERLRQSILKQAFSGKLVPQDPNDEPASVLLERIRSEREAEAQASPANKGKSQRRGKRKATR